LGPNSRAAEPDKEEEKVVGGSGDIYGIGLVALGSMCLVTLDSM